LQNKKGTRNLKGGFGGKGFSPNLTSGTKNVKKETLGFLFKEQSELRVQILPGVPQSQWKVES